MKKTFGFWVVVGYWLSAVVFVLTSAFFFSLWHWAIWIITFSIVGIVLTLIWRFFTQAFEEDIVYTPYYEKADEEDDLE